MRKHHSQMNEEEIKAVESFVRNNSFEINSSHSLEEMSDEGITADQVDDVLAHGNVVEVCNHDATGSLRILIRKTVGDFDVCVVVGVRDRVIVTTWRNDTGDDHPSLKKQPYSWKVNLKDLLTQLQ